MEELTKVCLNIIWRNILNTLEGREDDYSIAACQNGLKNYYIYK